MKSVNYVLAAFLVIEGVGGFLGLINGALLSMMFVTSVISLCAEIYFQFKAGHAEQANMQQQLVPVRIKNQV